ncbi:MAG: ABC transporter ATP-binding protein [Streptococcaceae bacterium]|jgi:putative ABC transport system ATP-binding protein|nr:ABC transporter ATP-binding protein [Streptococcaceae bacterium]
MTVNNVLVMENVVKKFGQGHTEVTALKGIDFSVSPGEFVSIIGPSGSGKSTFLTIAGGLQSLTSGKIEINGQDYSHMSEKARSRARFKNIGFILQTSNLIPFLKVREQFEFIERLTRQKNEDKIKNLLESLDIWDLREKYPKSLSGGERQRVAIARSLFNNPSLILADEPTASLDSNHAFEVAKLLAKEAHGLQKAIVMVTHDERMTQWCDRIYQMSDGVLSQVK